MMRRQSIFGQDAQVFRPERYLECDQEKKHEMIRTVDLTFGYGRWMCAGKTLALIELNKIIFEVCRSSFYRSLTHFFYDGPQYEANLCSFSKLMRSFDWQLIYPGRAWKEEAYTAWIQRDMWVSITEAEDL